MAMTFEFNIRPFGYQNDAITFGRMRVHSAGDHHEYAVDYKTKNGWQTVRGSVKKRMDDGKKRSGHRNFLHLLAAIMDDIDLDALGENYVNILAEVQEAYPNHNRATADYPDE
jgi:hypothetical protein